MSSKKQKRKPRSAGSGRGVLCLHRNGGKVEVLDGFTDYIFMTVDMGDPANPRAAGRFWTHAVQ
jgi:hypothetical protein